MNTVTKEDLYKKFENYANVTKNQLVLSETEEYINNINYKELIDTLFLHLIL